MLRRGVCDEERKKSLGKLRGDASFLVEPRGTAEFRLSLRDVVLRRHFLIRQHDEGCRADASERHHF